MDALLLERERASDSVFEPTVSEPQPEHHQHASGFQVCLCVRCRPAFAYHYPAPPVPTQQDAERASARKSAFSAMAAVQQTFLCSYNKKKVKVIVGTVGVQVTTHTHDLHSHPAQIFSSTTPSACTSHNGTHAPTRPEVPGPRLRDRLRCSPGLRSPPQAAQHSANHRDAGVDRCDLATCCLKHKVSPCHLADSTHLAGCCQSAGPSTRPLPGLGTAT